MDGRGLGKGIWYESVVERVMSALKMESLDVARIVCRPGAVGLGLNVTDIFRLFFVRSR